MYKAQHNGRVMNNFQAWIGKKQVLTDKKIQVKSSKVDLKLINNSSVKHKGN